MVAGLYPDDTSCLIPVIPCHSTTVPIHLILIFGLGVTSRLSLVPHISAEAKGLCMHLDLQQNCVERSMFCAVVVGMSGCKGCLENELTESLSPRSVLFCFSHPLRDTSLSQLMPGANSDSPGDRRNNWFGTAL